MIYSTSPKIKGKENGVSSALELKEPERREQGQGEGAGQKPESQKLEGEERRI